MVSLLSGALSISQKGRDDVGKNDSRKLDIGNAFVVRSALAVACFFIVSKLSSIETHMEKARAENRAALERFHTNHEAIAVLQTRISYCCGE